MTYLQQLDFNVADALQVLRSSGALTYRTRSHESRTLSVVAPAIAIPHAAFAVSARLVGSATSRRVEATYFVSYDDDDDNDGDGPTRIVIKGEVHGDVSTVAVVSPRVGIAKVGVLRSGRRPANAAAGASSPAPMRGPSTGRATVVGRRPNQGPSRSGTTSPSTRGRSSC